MRRQVFSVIFVTGFWALGFAACVAFAGESDSAAAHDASVAASPAESSAPVPAKKHGVKKARGNGTREKETEGTEAPNRFEADTVIKSQYKLNGEQLEVDPD